MTYTDQLRLIAIGVLIAQPDKLKDVNLNAWSGWKRGLVTELKRCVEDSKHPQTRLRTILNETYGLPTDGRLMEVLLEKIELIAEREVRKRSGGKEALEARHEEANEIMTNRKKRNTSKEKYDA